MLSEDVSAIVLADADIGSVEVVVVLGSGNLHTVRAVVTELDETQDQLKSAFSRSGLLAWIAVSALPNYADAESMIVPGHGRQRVLDTQRVAGTVRFMLVTAPTAVGDFNPGDFLSMDFSTGE